MNTEAEGLPMIQVSTVQGKLLYLLAKMIGAKRILEIGTLGGYSTIWLARALGDGGKLVTLEYDPKHARVATDNIATAGLADRVEVRVGAALETLPFVMEEDASPFDLVFIDADKANNANYFEVALQMTRSGSVIIVDNVVRGGAVVARESTNPDVQGVRRCIELMGTDPRVESTALQTVGAKGYDGFAIARVR
jgi:predicted O-methyltransferase YrrM